MAQINYEFKSDFNERYSIVSRKILRMLSEDSRVSISDIAKSVGLSRKTVADRIKRLENELGIRYTVELNEDKLGLINSHLIFVKLGAKPDLEHIRSVFLRSHIPQFVASVKGDYDMLIYTNGASRQEYVHWDKNTQILLSDYKVLWYPSEMSHRQLGFFPLRNEIIERLNVPQKYRDILKLLNLNSRASFQELSKKLGVHFNTLAYNLKKLTETGYIKRFTTLLKPIENTTIMSMFGKYVLTSTFEEDAINQRKAFMSDDDYSLIGRYPFICQLIGSHDFFGLGVFDSAKVAYKQAVLYYKNTLARQKVKVSSGIIDKVLIGSLPLRSMDTKKEFKTIRWTPDFKEP